MTRPKEGRPENEKQLAVWVSTDIKNALAEAAEREGKSQKAVLEEAIASYLKTKLTAPSREGR